MVHIKFPSGNQFFELANRIRDVAGAVRAMDGSTVNVKLEPDASGRIDCQCRQCGELFKVEGERWRSHDAVVFCVYQGNTAPKSGWLPEQHLAAARQAVIDAKQAQIRQIMAGGGSALAPHGAVESLTRDGNGRDRLALLPMPALELLRSARSCPQCGCSYSFIGAAYFCPLCGHRSADIALRQTIETTRAAVAAMRGTLAAADADAAALTRQHLLEYGVMSIVGAFESVGNEFYNQKAKPPAPRMTFQRLSGKGSGNELWKATTGHAYEDHISVAELNRLVVCFQMRHILAHCVGVVDADYLAKSRDTKYKLGERLRVTEEEVLEFVGIVERLVDGMRGDL